MSNHPFNSNYGTNTTVSTADINSFLVGATSSPTPDTGSYARFQKIGTIVNLEFKYKFLTIGSGAMSINLPLPINTNYPKPQSICHIRYLTAPDANKVYIGHYNENTASSVNIVFSTTYGGIPVSLTTTSPLTLVIGDILTGLIIYETS
jgi:hypothetical protein